MIDEKKLIEELEKTFPDRFLNKKEWGMGKYSFMDLFKVLVETMPKVGEWIPVSERLPEEYGEYLCCDAYKNYIIGYPVRDNHGVFVETETMYMCECVAWMPLPEPYKGVEW